MQHNTLPKHDQKLPFTRYDFGWVLLCIGMAIGAGTVLMPVQIGLKEFGYLLPAAIIAYPATWVVQDIYLKPFLKAIPVMTTPILSVITGKNWGIFLRVIYFLMIIHGIFIYSLSVVFDSASLPENLRFNRCAIFHNLYFIKSPFSPYWWQLRLVVNDYCLRFPGQWWWSK